MGRRLFSQAAKLRRLTAAGGLLKIRNLAGQAVDLLLLAHDHRVQPFEQVFREAGLDLQVREALVNCRRLGHGKFGTVASSGSRCFCAEQFFAHQVNIAA